MHIILGAYTILLIARRYYDVFVETAHRAQLSPVQTRSSLYIIILLLLLLLLLLFRVKTLTPVTVWSLRLTAGAQRGRMIFTVVRF